MTFPLLRRALAPLASPASWRLTPSLVTVRHSSSEFTTRPGPPMLPRQQQKEFEELIRRVNAPASKAAEGMEEDDQELEISMEDLAMHPDFRKKPKPTFEGNIDPETGEVGGPKRNPLAHGDWSYGGKCTDF
ncbi:hypothetical protein P7C70_g5049, partial [Phenoliferia sp. Uapishka_3]